jgi:ParB-like chromosome segregation protein Spo0J
MTVIRLAGEREVRDLAHIFPYEQNNKIHTEERINQMVEAIKSGYDQPITVDSHGLIIKGHRRYFAVKKMGASKVEVIVRDDLSDEAVRLARIVDNTIVHNDWSLDHLMTEIKELNESGTIGSLLELGINEGDSVSIFGKEASDELLDLLAGESETEADELLERLNEEEELNQQVQKDATSADQLVDPESQPKFELPVGDDEFQVPDTTLAGDEYSTVKPLTLNMTINQRRVFLSNVSKAKEVLGTTNLADTVILALQVVTDGE